MNLFDKITGINSRVIPGRNTTDTFGSASNFFGGTQKSILPQAYTQQAPTQFGMPTQPSIQPPKIQQEDPITAQFKAKGYDDKDIEFLKQAKAKGYTSQQAFGYLDSKKKIQQPVQETPITDNFKMKSSEEFGLVEGAKDIGKFFVNVPADSAQVVGGLYDAVRHPINTLSSMYNIGQGISDKAVFSIANSISSALGGKTVGPTEEAKLVGAIGNELVNKYGTAGKFKKAVVENPADTLLTLMGGLGVVSKVAEANNMTNVVNNINKIQQVISPVNILKQESKLITKPLGYAGKEVLPQVLGKTTGTSAETIRTAFTQGGTPEFQSALRGETTPQNILSNVQEGMQAIKNDRAIAYGADYAKLQANKTQLAIDDVAKSFIKSLQDEYKIGVGKNGLDFSQSKITGGTSQSQIENMYKDIVGWKDKTPEGLDVLKQRLQDYYRGTPDSSKGDRLSTIASNAIKQKIVENVPEYANMTANYEKLTNDIRDITKTLSLGDKTQAQTAITKLSSVLRENFSARQDMVKLIEQYTGKNIQGQIAGASLNPLLAKGLAGVITGGGIVFGQLANPTFWGGLALASPRLIGEIANTIGVPIQKFKSAINNIKNANTTSNTTRSAMEGSTKVKPFTKTPIVAPKVTPKKTVKPARDLLQEKFDADNAKMKPIIIEDGKVTPKKITPTPEKTVKPQKVETNITRNEAIEKGFSDSAKARWDKGEFTQKERGEATTYLKSNYKGKEYTIDGKKYKVDAIDNRNEQVRLVDSEGNILRVKTNKLPETKVSPSDIQDYYNARVQKGYKTIKDPTKTTVNLSQSKGGFIRLPFTSKLNVKPQPKQLFAGENAKAPPKGKTGWFKGADGKMRFEIDDSVAKIVGDFSDKNGEIFGNKFTYKTVDLGDLLKHDELFRQYPELRKVRVEINSKMGNSIQGNIAQWRDTKVGDSLGAIQFNSNSLFRLKSQSEYAKKRTLEIRNTPEYKKYASEVENLKWNDPKFDELTKKFDSTELGKEYNKVSRDQSVYNDEFKSTLLHEIQHAIQTKEGFAKGGSTANGHDEYTRIAGEVEARNVQSRMNLTAKERTIKSPESTEDVPRPKQIIRMDGKGPSMSIKGEGIKVYKGVNGEGNGKKFPLDYFTTDKKSASQYGKEVIETTIYPKKIADFTNPSNKAELRKILRDNLDPRVADEFIDRAMEGKDSFSNPLYEMVENPKVTQALKDAGYDSTKYLDYGNKNSKFARHETIAMLDVKPISKPKSIKGDEALMSEAKKYGSAEDFADGVFGAEKGNTYKNVPKDLIDNEYLDYFDNNIYFKQKIDKGTVESWKERIKKGERPPIKIDDTNGRFELGDGYHRYQAYKELGFEKIPVFYKSELISLFNKIK